MALLLPHHCHMKHFFVCRDKKKYWPRPEELINHFGRRPEMRRGALLVPLGAPLFFLSTPAWYLFVSTNPFFGYVDKNKLSPMRINSIVWPADRLGDRLGPDRPIRGPKKTLKARKTL